MTDWVDGAVCRGRPTWWWFDADPFVEAVAVALCRRCPVRTACLAAALVEEAGAGPVLRAGVRGGLTARQRHPAGRRCPVAAPVAVAAPVEPVDVPLVVRWHRSTAAVL